MIGTISGLGLRSASTMNPIPPTLDSRNAQAAAQTMIVSMAPCWRSMANGQEAMARSRHGPRRHRQRGRGRDNANSRRPDPLDQRHCIREQRRVAEAVDSALFVEVRRTSPGAMASLHEDAPVEGNAAGDDKGPPVDGERTGGRDNHCGWPPVRQTCQHADHGASSRHTSSVRTCDEQGVTVICSQTCHVVNGTSPRIEHVPASIARSRGSWDPSRAHRRPPSRRDRCAPYVRGGRQRAIAIDDALVADRPVVECHSQRRDPECWPGDDDDLPTGRTADAPIPSGSEPDQHRHDRADRRRIVILCCVERREDQGWSDDAPTANSAPGTDPRRRCLSFAIAAGNQMRRPAPISPTPMRGTDRHQEFGIEAERWCAEVEVDHPGARLERGRREGGLQPVDVCDPRESGE